MPDLEIQKTVKVSAKVLQIHVKCTDRFCARLTDQDGDIIYDQDDGYVPSFMPGDHYGDYIILDIDIESGKVLNWPTVSGEQIQEWIAEED